jgi:serine/threonine protein kinase
MKGERLSGGRRKQFFEWEHAGSRDGAADLREANQVMSVSIPEFWKLVFDSRLLAPEQCQMLGAEYGRVKGAAAQGNAKTLAEWLVSRNALTPYQTTILLAGRSGPFIYGDYKLYDRVDQGRLGGQFRAVHAATNHLVMLQFLTGAVTQDSRQWSAAASRIQSQCEITHVNLQRFFEVVDLGSFKFMVTEDLRGQSLEQLLASAGKLPPAEAARVVRQAALALTQLHQAGAIHGDIRPHNLWLDEAGSVKLLRDPLSTPAPLNLSQPDSSGQLAARADYFAPELNQSGTTPDVLTDVYALGCTLYHLLSGRPPFAGGDVYQKMSRHAGERIQPLEPFGVPQPLAQTVAYMMAKNPAVRYQQASVVADKLVPYVDAAQLHRQPPMPLQSLPVYENWLRHRSRTPAPSPASAFPGPQTSPRPVSAATSPTPLSFPPLGTPVASAGAAAAATAFAPQIQTVATVTQPVAPAVSIKASEPAAKAAVSEAPNYAELKQKKKMVMLASCLGAAAVLAIMGVIALNFMGGGNVPDNGVANANNRDGTDTVNTNTTGSDATGKGGTTTVGTGGTGTGGTTVVTTNGGGGVPVTPGGTGPGVVVTPPKVFVQDVVKDDGALLWASPTAGPAIVLDYLPPGSQIFVIARPSDMLAGGEGQRVIQALGPEFEAARANWEMASGVKLDQVEQLIMTLHDNDGKTPRPFFVVKLRTPMPEPELVARWGSPAPISDTNGTYYDSRGWSFHAPPRAAGQLFVMGAAPEVQHVMKFQGAPPPLRKEVDRLREVSDSQRHFTLLFAPNYLFNDEGQKLFTGSREKMLKPLFWFLGDGLQAGMVSMHFGGDFYLEMRLNASLEKEPFKLATEFRNRLKEVPLFIEDYIVSLNPHPFWKRAAMRYPQMINFVHANTRIGSEKDQAVINAVLPGPAAHNLFATSELVMVSTPGAAYVPTEGGPTTVAAGPKTMEEVLLHKMTFDIPQQDLINAAADVEKAVVDELRGLPFEFKIKLMGPDLKMDGITQNQRIADFKMANAPLGEILTGLARKANPDPSAKDASDPAQKLVWLIGPDPTDANKKIILFTTRQAAERDKLTLPPAFQLKSG